MPTTGEKPNVGTYKCTKCGELVHLDQNTDTLSVTELIIQEFSLYKVPYGFIRITKNFT